MKQKWAYCLSEEQYSKLLRNIKKVPGFLEYLDQNDKEDFILLALSYRSVLEKAGIVTPGIRTNVDLILHRYDLFQC